MSDEAKTWWDEAIARNRAALVRIVAALFFMAGLDGGGADVLPRRVGRKILRLLRPAEAAVRRLIVAAARDIAVGPPARPTARPPSAIERLRAAGLLVVVGSFDLGLARAPRAAAEPQAAGPRIPAFPLADRPKRFGLAPRPFPQAGVAPADGAEPVDAAHLCRRIMVLKAALDDLPRHARRFACWRARRAAAAGRPRPLRPGWPPGHRERPLHEIDHVLRECHSLALRAAQGARQRRAGGEELKGGTNDPPPGTS